jgi:hypothetical protein
VTTTSFTVFQWKKWPYSMSGPPTRTAPQGTIAPAESYGNSGISCEAALAIRS